MTSQSIPKSNHCQTRVMLLKMKGISQQWNIGIHCKPWMDKNIPLMLASMTSNLNFALMI